jgi:alpha-amylase
MKHLNPLMFQAFHLYLPANGKLWEELQEKAIYLASVGFTSVWLPPAYKGENGIFDNGYNVYDLFDLGEFNQRRTIPTKYGTREQFIYAVDNLKNAGLQVYADIVFKVFGYGLKTRESFFPNDLLVTWDGKPYIRLIFPGRRDKYSSFKWDSWQPSEINVNNEQVRGELFYWGEWFLDTTDVDAFRLDAIEHIPAWFFVQWRNHLCNHAQKNLFFVGEYWTLSVHRLHQYIEATQGCISLLDVPLHFNFFHASKAGVDYDMRQILDNTLMQQQQTLAVTFVDNHNTQPLASFESTVEPWFKPLAYALILLRKEGFPCVFYADYYGADYEKVGRNGNHHHISMPSHRWVIDKFLYARKHYAYGSQYDYFDHFNTIGWTRLGDEDNPKAMAVLMSNGSEGYKPMQVGKSNAKFYDVTEQVQEHVLTNLDGWGEFYCKSKSVSVWIEQ